MCSISTTYMSYGTTVVLCKGGRGKVSINGAGAPLLLGTQSGMLTKRITTYWMETGSFPIPSASPIDSILRNG